jgi:hydrogenase/urease accessory protein HupE
LHHVLTGYDHLLFLAALALASVSWRRLLGIIAVFTAAHSITVTLAALGWVSLPPSIVEPVIAGSIVFVSLENVLAPTRSQRSSRLVVAFAFGLIHGLGFAGGLREALPNGSSAQLALPILAFCIGVELGHLAVGAPLYGIFRAAVPRAGSPTTPAPAGSTPALHPVIRWGSVLTACGGAGYLWAALQSA